LECDMKILIFAHQLEVGGTQTNAIELATSLRDFYGHEIVFFATPGPMVSLVEEKGLRYLPAPDVSMHPSPARMKALRDAVQTERPDLLHVWDWWQCLDAFYAVHLPMRIPMVVTDMNMSLTRLLPKMVPTTFGTPELVDIAKSAGRQHVELILPPVDTTLNSPGAVSTLQFSEQFAVKKDDITLVSVSRLSSWMKAESLIRTIDVVGTLGRDVPLRFIIVGDGDARTELEQLASDVNISLGRDAVVFAGALLDPRPAYAAADIVVGMGGSALRGMAFGKPVVIVGERGFSAPFTPETAEFFHYKGIYGLGDGSPDNARLAEHIREVAGDPDRISFLGAFSRKFVVEHFSLQTVSAKLEEILRNAAREVPRFQTVVADGLRTAAICLRERNFLRDGHPLRRRLRFWKQN
jgi:L-malate glycosyltransferase